jgi:hypothetical protein
MFNRIFAVLTGMLCFIHGNSQEQCGFDILHKKALATDTAYQRAIREQKQFIRKQIESQRNARVMAPQAALYTIPVVVHVVHTGGAIGSPYNPTDLQIQNTIADLNAIYDGTKAGTEGVGDMQIQFVLATRDPLCAVTTGITRTNGSGITNYVSNGVNVSTTGGTDQLNVKNLIRWDPTRYYNIWVVNEIDNHDGTTGGSFTGGFAYLPGAPLNLDGTVMLASQMQPNRKTLPHEIGHAFGLYHPFEGGTTAVCPANADCTADGDEVCDTDPILQPTTGVCRTGMNACAGLPYSINTEHNYMNYTGCATLFTADQRDRVLGFAGSYYRISLSASWGGSPTYPIDPFVTPVAASCTPVTSATGLSNNFAGLMGFELGGRVFASGTAMMDGGYRNGTTSCLNLIQLTRGNIYNYSFIPLSSNYEQLRGWIDYDNNGVFDNATEQIVFQNDIGPPDPLNVFVNGSLTVPLTATANTVLRMRITEELSTRYGGSLNITGGCYNPVYGQAEDYPMILMPETLLPVNYEYFTAAADGGNVQLKWKTSSEINASVFYLERASMGNAFKTIAERKAQGTNSVYQYTDEKPGNGSWYYRIRQVDIDGTAKYSEVKAVNIAANPELKMKLLSNPFRTDIGLIFSSPVNDNIQFRLTDVSGRMIHSQAMKGDGQTRITLGLGAKSIPKGVYFLEVAIGNHKFIEQVLKQ